MVSLLSLEVTSLLNGLEGRVLADVLSEMDVSVLSLVGLDVPVVSSVGFLLGEIASVVLIDTVVIVGSVVSGVFTVFVVEMVVCEVVVVVEGEVVVVVEGDVVVVVIVEIVEVTGGIEEKLHLLLSDSKATILMFLHSGGSVQQ